MGITLIDFMAASALQGLLAKFGVWPRNSPAEADADMAATAYRIAYAMRDASLSARRENESPEERMEREFKAATSLLEKGEADDKPAPMKWSTVKVIADVGTECGLIPGDDGTLTIAVRQPDRSWPHGTALAVATNTIAPGYTSYIVT